MKIVLKLVYRIFNLYFFCIKEGIINYRSLSFKIKPVNFIIFFIIKIVYMVYTLIFKKKEQAFAKPLMGRDKLETRL